MKTGILVWSDLEIVSPLGSKMSFLSDSVGSIYSHDRVYRSSSIFSVAFSRRAFQLGSGIDFFGVVPRKFYRRKPRGITSPTAKFNTR